MSIYPKIFRMVSITMHKNIYQDFLKFFKTIEITLQIETNSIGIIYKKDPYWHPETVVQVRALNDFQIRSGD